MKLFLDTNAHIPLIPKALETYISYSTSLNSHGHTMSSSILGRSAASDLEEAREKIAQLIGAKTSKQIFFTSTGTQACEYGLEILKNQNFEKVYCSTIEHKSVQEKAKFLFGNNDLLVSKDGMVNCTYQPNENSAIICIHVQNEIGTIQPIEQIKVPFFSDLSQSIGKIPVNVSNISNLKIAAFGAHKFGGSSSVGILYLQDEKWWIPCGTGSRYNFDRPGTIDVASILATTTALEEAIKTLPKRYERALDFRGELENYLTRMNLEIIGISGNRIPHTSFIKVGKGLGSFIMNQLEAEGIYIGLGSACGSVYSNSPIMTALGRSGKANDYIRISQFGNYGKEEGFRTAKAISKYCPK